MSWNQMPPALLQALYKYLRLHENILESLQLPVAESKYSGTRLSQFTSQSYHHLARDFGQFSYYVCTYLWNEDNNTDSY
jgi:hypothetical protein